MNNAKTKLQSLGFTAGHVQLLTVAMAVFVVLIVAKSDINLKTMFANADDEVKMVTYEDMLAEATAEYGVDFSNMDDGSAEQVALLDLADDIDGQVLGEAIGIGKIPDADELILPEIDSRLSVNLSSVESAELREQYVEWTQNIESDGNITGLLGDLNASDPDVLRKSVAGWEWVIAELGEVVVPPSLEKFHKTKMVYYSVLMNLGKVYAGDKTDADMALLAKAMLSYSEKIEILRQEVNTQYSLNL